MSRKALYLILGSILLGLAAIGILLGFLLTRPSGEVSSLSRYIPSDVPVGLFVRLPVGDAARAWSPLSDVLSEIPGFQAGIGMLGNTTLFPGTNIRLKQDVEPWLGSSLAVGLTQMPVSIETENLPFLLAVEVRDGQAFNAFLGRLRSELERVRMPLEESTYGRHTFFAVPRQGFYFALRDEHILLLSNDPDALKAALEREEKDSLAGNAEYQALLRHLPPGGVLQIYVSSEYLNQAQRQAATGPGDLPPNAVLQAGAFTLLVETEGLREEFAFLFDREAQDRGGRESLDWTTPNPERALVFLPKESLFIFSIRLPSLEGFSEGILSALRQTDYSAYLELQRTLRELSQKGWDVEKDLLRWLGGEVGLFIALDQKEGIPLGEDAPFMRLGLVAEVKDLEKVRQGMQKAEDLLGREAGFSFFDREISGLTFRTSRVPEEPSLTLGYTMVDNFLLFALDEASLRSLAQAWANPEERLPASKEFQTVLRSLPRLRVALLFLNLEGLWKTLASALPAEARQNARMWLPIVEHFPGLGLAFATVQPGDKVATATLFLHIVR